MGLLSAEFCAYCNVLSSTRAVALMLAWFIVSQKYVLLNVQCKKYTYQWAPVSRIQSLYGVVVSICIIQLR